MINCYTSEMEIEDSRIEDYDSDPVIKREIEMEKIRALGEKLDEYRLKASQLLMAGISEYWDIYDDILPCDSYFNLAVFYEYEGIIGLDKKLAQISNSLRLEYLRIKLGS